MKIQPINNTQTIPQRSISFNANLYVTDAVKNNMFKEIDRLYGGGCYYTETDVQGIKNRFLLVMKKFKFIACAIAATLALVGCGNKKDLPAGEIADKEPLNETVVFDTISSSTPKESPFLHSYDVPNCEMRIRDKVVNYYYPPGAINESNQVENLYNAFKHLQYIYKK